MIDALLRCFPVDDSLGRFIGLATEVKVVDGVHDFVLDPKAQLSGLEKRTRGRNDTRLGVVLLADTVQELGDAVSLDLKTCGGLWRRRSRDTMKYGGM